MSPAIGSDFVAATCDRRLRCGECGWLMQAGQPCLVSVRNGKVQKRVCGEKCRLDFDARYWDEVAESRRRGQR